MKGDCISWAGFGKEMVSSEQDFKLASWGDGSLLIKIAFAELLPVELALCVQAPVAGCREAARHPRPPESERPRKPWNICQNNIIANEP